MKRFFFSIFCIAAAGLLGCPEASNGEKCACSLTCEAARLIFIPCPDPEKWRCEPCPSGSGLCFKSYASYGPVIEVSGDYECFSCSYACAFSACAERAQELSTGTVVYTVSYYNKVSGSCAPTSYCYSLSALPTDAPQQDSLRSFRDHVLVSDPAGLELVTLYYTYSPALVAIMETHDTLNAYARRKLLKVSALIDEYLYGKGLSDEQYEDLMNMIEDGLSKLRSLGSTYERSDGRAQDPPPPALEEDVRTLLDDNTLAYVRLLIVELLDELRMPPGIGK